MSSSDLNTKLANPPCSPESVSPGSITTLHIEKLVAGGLGLGRLNGQVVLCTGGIPGERVQVEILQKRKGVVQGKILEVQESAESRVLPVCPVVEQCGGCQLQHIQYDAQLVQKRLMLEDTLRRIAKISDVTISPVIASPQSYGYRQVLRMGIVKGPDGVFLGFFKAGTQQLLPVDRCYLVDEKIQAILTAVCSNLRSSAIKEGKLESVEIRWSELDNEGLLIFRGRALAPNYIEDLINACTEIPTITGCIYEHIPDESQSRRRGKDEPFVKGTDHLWENFGGLRLKIGYQSFMQANWACFQFIGEILETWLGNLQGQRILELYAGTGPLGIKLAQQGASVTCVEGSPFAVHDVREAIAVNNIARCRVKRSSVESYLMSVKPGGYDVILLDPPRTGLHTKVVERLGNLQVPRLLYLSCDAPTLARDIKALCEKGYEIHRIQPLDMFPQTAHLETLVELTLARSSTHKNYQRKQIRIFR